MRTACGRSRSESWTRWCLCHQIVVLRRVFMRCIPACARISRHLARHAGAMNVRHGTLLVGGMLASLFESGRPARVVAAEVIGRSPPIHASTLRR